jgi:NAD(P)-dependent dehydrogenase (short-subunit alcohol dehydrogenase family)
MPDLEGRCAVVTGGGHGIGRALAEALAGRGAKVVVADLNEARAQKIAQRVDGLAVPCDVGERRQILGLVAAAEKTFGPVHLFCSNAGLTDQQPGLGASPEELTHVVDVNLLAHVWAAQAVLPAMVERGVGYLLQTVSSAALITGPSGMAYTLTKHGALGFAEWLSLNYGHLGITVTCLCPNAVNTGMLGRDEDLEDQQSVGSGARSGDDVLRQSLGDVVEPELCAELALEALSLGHFLALPHPRVGESFQRKAGDYDRWLQGTNRRLRRMRGEPVGEDPTSDRGERDG